MLNGLHRLSDETIEISFPYDSIAKPCSVLSIKHDISQHNNQLSAQIVKALKLPITQIHTFYCMYHFYLDSEMALTILLKQI